MNPSVKYSARGVALYNEGRYQEAIGCFEEAVQAGGDDAQTRRFLAHAYASLGRTDEAVRQLREAFRLGSDPSAVFDALRMIMGEAARFGETEESLKLAAEKAPNSGGMRLVLGGLYFEQGRLQEAEEHLRDAVRCEPALGQARIMLGRVVEALGRPDEAEEIYREAARAAPRSVDVRLRQGEFYLTQGRWSEAEAPLREAVRLNASFMQGHLLLGRVREAQGHSKDAEGCYRAALRVNPASAQARERLGEFCMRQGRFSEAEKLLREAMRKETAAARSCLLLAEMLIGREKLEAAEKCLKEGGKKWPQEPRIFSKLGWLYQRLDQPAALRASFKRYLAAAKEEYPHRFLAQVALGDFAGAIREAERALDFRKAELDDRFFHPWADDWFPPRPSVFYERQLEKAAALRRVEPRSPWPGYFRGLLLAHLGRRRESLAEFDGMDDRVGERYGWMRYPCGLSRLTLGLYREAVGDFNAALKSRPGLWMARCHLAETYLCLGDSTKAFREFDRAQARCDEKAAADVRAWRGEALLWTGLYGEAVRELDRAAQAGSDFAHTWRGAAHMLAGEHEKALDDLNRAAAGGTRDAEVYLWRGELYRRMGRHEEALAELDRSLDYGGRTWARVNRALTLAALGRVEEMWADFEALPVEVLDYENGKAGIDLRRLDKEKIVSLLEGALAAACGVRRPERYAADVWRSRAKRGGAGKKPEKKGKAI